MNQNGDPSQAWIKIKPDGRVDVFSGTSDIGNGSRRSRARSSPKRSASRTSGLRTTTRTPIPPRFAPGFASRATFVAGEAVRKAALSAREKLLEIAGKELEIDPSDLDVVDGEVIAKGAPQKKISVPDVAAAATWGHGELITGTGAELKPLVPIQDPDHRRRRIAAPLCHLVRHLRGRGRSGR